MRSINSSAVHSASQGLNNAARTDGDLHRIRGKSVCANCVLQLQGKAGASSKAKRWRECHEARISVDTDKALVCRRRRGHSAGQPAPEIPVPKLINPPVVDQDLVDRGRNLDGWNTDCEVGMRAWGEVVVLA